MKTLDNQFQKTKTLYFTFFIYSRCRHHHLIFHTTNSGMEGIRTINKLDNNKELEKKEPVKKNHEMCNILCYFCFTLLIN